VREGDSPLGVAAAALETLGVEFGPREAHDYVHTICGPYNLDTYGSSLTTKKEGAALLVPGLGQGILAAFRPRNADALAFMRRGKRPPCTVDRRTGAALGSGDSFGVLWLPPVCPRELQSGNVTCRPFPWDDGSSSIDPPPDLMERLEATE
jgi:hypothetical protein